MAVSARSLAHALAAIVGADRLVDGGAALARAAVDGRTPRWLVRPAAVEQVAAVLAVAWEEGLAVVPRGSGTALGLGCPPARVDVVLDLAGLDHVLDWNPEDLTASVEAGLTLGAVQARLAPRRQFLPLDPPEGAARTIGGLTATNASGPLRVRYGGMRDLLLGVRFVQPDGVLTWGGARVVKSVSGYDVPKLMVGALGTLGVLVEATLRLHPLPEVERSWLARFGSLYAAQAFLAGLLDSPVQPNRVEWLNARALERVGAPAAPAAVAVSIGSVEAAVAAGSESVRALVLRQRGEVAEVAGQWWERYGGRFARDPVVLRVATLPSHVAQTVAEIERALGEPVASVAGSAAVGALDVSTPGARSVDLARALDGLRAFLGPLGGHAMVTRAPAEVRAALDPWGPVDPGPLALMRALKAEFDAKGILNPGRFVAGL